jgi:hypothetical protein
MTSQTHVKELALRRFFAGELGEPERPAIEAHTAGCPSCRARLKELGDEQRRFEQAISFDRFAAGVERAARTPRRVPAPKSGTARWGFPALGLAAAMALTLAFAPMLRPGQTGANRIKGGGSITVQIAGAGADPQRAAAADAPEPLSPGERVRIGYQPGGHRYLTSLSIDDQGEITTLYPEAGRSLPVGRGAAAATRYLPDSVEFTGKGNELLIVVLSDQALDVDAVKKAARAAFQKAGGDLTRLPALDVPGEQFQRTFVKP